MRSGSRRRTYLLRYSQTSRYGQQLGCIGQAYLIFYGWYSCGLAGKMGYVRATFIVL
jgi:hypothetical protein